MHSYVFLYPFWVTCIRVSELADRGWGPRICIPHKPPSDADAAGRGITLGEQLLSARISKSVAMNHEPSTIVNKQGLFQGNIQLSQGYIMIDHL